MTNPTLERAARAVRDMAVECSGMAVEPWSVHIARAVLMAVREPDEAMVEAFWRSPANNGPDPAPSKASSESEWYGSREEFDAAFTAMIDAILADGGE